MHPLRCLGLFAAAACSGGANAPPARMPAPAAPPDSIAGAAAPIRPLWVFTAPGDLTAIAVDGNATCVVLNGSGLQAVSASGQLEWTRSLMGANGYAIAMSGDDSIIVAGRFSRTVDFGAGALYSSGNSDAFLASFAPGGSHRWSARIQAADSDFVTELVLDLNNDLITTIVSPDRGGLLVKYSREGKQLWQRGLGDSGLEAIRAIAVNRDGGLLLAGQRSGGSDDAAVLAALTPTGDPSGTRAIPPGVGPLIAGMVIDPAGDLLLVGPSGAPPFGSIAVVRVSPEGSVRWTRHVAQDPRFRDPGGGIAIDGRGNVVIGGTLATSRGAAVVVKLSATGAILWKWTSTCCLDSRHVDVAIAPDGQVLVAGTFGHNIDLGDGPRHVERETLFLAKLPP